MCTGVSSWKLTYVLSNYCQRKGTDSERKIMGLHKCAVCDHKPVANDADTCPNCHTKKHGLPSAFKLFLYGVLCFVIFVFLSDVSDVIVRLFGLVFLVFGVGYVLAAFNRDWVMDKFMQ